jgi:hypothetical protein
MQFFEAITAEQYAWGMIITGIIFGISWYYDHLTHLRIWKKDITDGELRTHRMIFYASYGLIFALLLMAWFPLQALPLFIACWLARTLHETIDEIHWHLPRCTERETISHLIMLISAHAGILIVFAWGFFFQYEGLTDLPRWMHAAFIILTVFYAYVGHHERFYSASRA